MGPKGPTLVRFHVNTHASAQTQIKEPKIQISSPKFTRF